MTHPSTKAARRIMRWIDQDATDDRMIYAVVKNGPTVGDLRAALLESEREARTVGFNDSARRTLDAIRRDRGIPDGEPLLTIIVPPESEAEKPTRVASEDER